MRMLPTRLIQMNLQILGHISFDCMPQQTKKANKIIHFGGLAPGSYSKISDPVLAIFLVSNNHRTLCQSCYLIFDKKDCSSINIMILKLNSQLKKKRHFFLKDNCSYDDKFKRKRDIHAW